MRLQLPQFRSASSVLTALMVGASVIGALVPAARFALVFVPGMVIDAPWSILTVLTYGFVATDPLGVIFGALILWSIGGALENAWGSRRLVIFAVGSTALAALATLLVSLLVTSLQRYPYAGSTVMTGALWVAYGLWIGTRQANFWGLPVTGNQLALIGVGFVVLNGAFNGWALEVPSAFAILFAYMAARGLTPGNAWLRVRSWQLSRQLNRRSSHLKVVSGDKRNMPNDSDRYLH